MIPAKTRRRRSPTVADLPDSLPEATGPEDA